MIKNIYLFTFFKRYYYAETDKEKKNIFEEFMNIIKNSSYEDFHLSDNSVLEMIYDYKYINKCSFKKQEFDFAISSCLKKAFNNYIPPEEYENGEYNENRKSSLGRSNEDLLMLYLGKHLFWYLISWKKKYDSGNYIICKVCGDLIKKQKNVRNKKYCNDCAKVVKLKQMRKANKKYYNSYKVKEENNPNI